MLAQCSRHDNNGEQPWAVAPVVLYKFHSPRPESRRLARRIIRFFTTSKPRLPCHNPAGLPGGSFGFSLRSSAASCWGSEKPNKPPDKPAGFRSNWGSRCVVENRMIRRASRRDLCRIARAVAPGTLSGAAKPQPMFCKPGALCRIPGLGSRFLDPFRTCHAL